MAGYWVHICCEKYEPSFWEEIWCFRSLCVLLEKIKEPVTKLIIIKCAFIVSYFMYFFVIYYKNTFLYFYSYFRRFFSEKYVRKYSNVQPQLSESWFEICFTAAKNFKIFFFFTCLLQISQLSRLVANDWWFYCEKLAEFVLGFYLSLIHI